MTNVIAENIKNYKSEIIEFLAPPDEEKWAILVPIRSKGVLPPFFCFHGMGGNVLNYSQLALRLPEGQPMFGLQSFGLDGVTPPLKSISAMVERYAVEINRVHPSGPLYLGGGSMGGVLALEVARSFLNQGREIGLLILFDTIGPHVSGPGGLEKPTFSRLNDLVASSRLSEFLSIFGARVKSRLDARKRMAFCREHLRIGKAIPLEHRLWYLEKINMKALESHKVEFYPGKVVLVRGSLVGEIPALADPNRGWMGVAGELVVHPICGDHDSLVEVPQLGRILGDCLTEALEL
jgi:thioesterase domain-containing protein